MAHAFCFSLSLSLARRFSLPRDTHPTFIARSPRREKNRPDHRAAKTKRFIVASSRFAVNSNPIGFRDLWSGIVGRLCWRIVEGSLGCVVFIILYGKRRGKIALVVLEFYLLFLS